jgi:hypothetical protein
MNVRRLFAACNSRAIGRCFGFLLKDLDNNSSPFRFNKNPQYYLYTENRTLEAHVCSEKMSSLENILYYRSSGRESSTSIFPGMIDHTTLSQQIPKEILVRRNSVSAESVIPGQGANNGLSTTVYRKTEEQKRRLLSVLKSVFLFSGLDQEQYSQVMNAFMEKVIVNEGTEVRYLGWSA